MSESSTLPAGRRRTRAKRAYPTPAQIAKVVQGARDAGVNVVGVEVTPDGSIRVSDIVSPQAKAPTDEFLNWEDRL